MYKTIWFITYNDEKVRFTQYHFGKKPRFPQWFMDEEGTEYHIEMLWNFKLMPTFKIFVKCLFKEWISQ